MSAVVPERKAGKVEVKRLVPGAKPLAKIENCLDVH